MEPTDVTSLLDALTGGTSAERFGEFLAAGSPQELPIAPAFDMPLLAAHQSFPPESPSLTPAMLSGGALDLLPTPLTHYDYGLPVSAVTGTSTGSDGSEPPAGGIRKKRARTSLSSSPKKSKPEQVMYAASAAAAAAAFGSGRSTGSDVSSLSLSHASQSPYSTSSPAGSPASEAASRSRAEVTPAQSMHVLATERPHSSSSSLPKSHTRKCREKVTKQFENLLEVLPHPPKGTEIKHKAQILEYTIKVFRHLLLRRTSLQTEVALASKDALRQWMNVSISSALAMRGNKPPAKPVPVSVVMEPFVGLYCVKKSWTYGEMWLVDPDTNQASLASCVFNTDDDDLLRRYDSFASVSRARYGGMRKLESGIISRIIGSRRPEWLDDVACDETVFDRALLAKQHGVRVAEAVPVMLDAKRCTGVLLFADVEPHAFSLADMSTLLDYTSVLGSLFAQYVNSFPSSTPNQKPAGAGNTGKTTQCGNHDPEGVMEDLSGLAAVKSEVPGSFGSRPVSGIAVSSPEASFFGETEFVLSR